MSRKELPGFDNHRLIESLVPLPQVIHRFRNPKRNGWPQSHPACEEHLGEGLEGFSDGLRITGSAQKIDQRVSQELWREHTTHGSELDFCLRDFAQD